MATGKGQEDELERVRLESIERLEQGRLPMEAEKRLGDLRERPGFFTSDLTVSEFALGHQIGVRPISQVMGSCVYHASLTMASALSSWSYANESRESNLARPWNAARTTALKRLAMEAAECGADAVIGVHLRTDAREFDAHSVEFQAIGTAVKVEGATTRGEPILSALSATDYWRLRQAGCRVVGLVATTQAVIASQRVPKYRSYSNREYTALAQGIRDVVHQANADLARQAAKMRAHGIVGVTVEREQREFEVESTGGYERLYFIVMAHMVGTAIIEGRGYPDGEPPSVLAVRRLDGTRPGRKRDDPSGPIR